MFDHGTATFKDDEDFKQFGAHNKTGILTCYLPDWDGGTFAVIFGEGQWCTFHCTEEEFLQRFDVVLKTQ